MALVGLPGSGKIAFDRVAGGGHRLAVASCNSVDAQPSHDTLTGLPIARLAMERLHRALDLGRRERAATALLFIDLDGFKSVNDAHGHATGDQVLQEVANRLTASIRSRDTAARIGGDEFIVIVGDLGGADGTGDVRSRSAAIPQKLIEANAQPMTLHDQRLQRVDVTIGASIGIALAPEDGIEVGEIRRLADQAMYRAKRGGHNRWCFANQADHLEAPGPDLDPVTTRLSAPAANAAAPESNSVPAT